MFAFLLASIATVAAIAATSPVAPIPAPSASARPNLVPANDPCGGDNRLLATLNRPTVGFSTCALPKGAIVLEEGYQSQSIAGAAGSTTVTYPQGFQRFGVAERFELDLIGLNLNRVRSQNGLVTGASDLGIGFKYELPQAGRFTYGVDGLFTAATGGQATSVPATAQGAAFGAPAQSFGYAAPSQTLDADIAYALSPAMGVGATIAQGTTGGLNTAGNRVRYGVFTPSIVVTAQLPKWTQFYAELVVQTKAGPDIGGHTFTDFGVQQLFGRNFEVDAEYGASFQPQADRFHYLGIGTGIRIR